MKNEGLGDLIDLLMLTTGLFYMLPMDVVINILARLSMKELSLCRWVCKGWLNLISQPCFAKAYHDRQIQTRFYPYVFLRNSSLQFYLINNAVFDDSHQSHVRGHQFKALTKDLGRSYYIVEDSENGLICFSSFPKYSYYICNPITGESITLRKFPRGKRRPLVTVLGFAPTTVEYKLIRLLLKTNKKRLNSSAEIYTLGSDRWRRIEDVPCIILPWANKVLVNGNFYWLAYCPKTRFLSILSLNVGTEEFIVIKPPVEKKIKVQVNYIFNEIKPLRALNYELIASREHLYFIDNSVANRTMTWVMETDRAQQHWAKILLSKEKVLGKLCCGFYDVVKLANGEFRVARETVDRPNVYYCDHQKESVKKMKYILPFSTRDVSL